MFSDLRFAVRQFNKNPGFALVAILSIALGIGATTSVFTIANATLLRAGPYRRPDDLVFVTTEKLVGGTSTAGVSGPQLDEWQKQNRSFAGMAAYDWTFNYLIHPDGNESVEGMKGSPALFNILGIHALLGRTFAADETSVKDHPVVLIGYDLWQRRFAADPNIVGKQIRISRLPDLTVIGVMPPGIRFLPSRSAANEPNYNQYAYVDYWLPEVPDVTDTEPYWNVVARLKPGVSVRQARAEMATLAASQTKTIPNLAGMTAAVTPVSDLLDGDTRRILEPLFGAVCLVLFIAGANVAGLLFVRGLRRQRELAIRSALGASRLQILRLTLTESLSLAVAGGILGVFLAFFATKILMLIAANSIPRLEDVSVDLRVVGFALGVSLMTGLASGVLATWQFLRPKINETLKAGSPGGGGPSGRRLLGCLVSGEVALTLILLVGAGLLVQTMIRLTRVNPGYETSKIITMVVTSLKPNIFEFHKEALEKVTTLSGVTSAAFVWGLPLTGNQWRVSLTIDGRPPPAFPRDRIVAPLRSVTPGYFGLMGVSLRSGRLFTDHDQENSPDVAIINEEMARRYFPNENPIGKFIRFDPRHPTEIVGIVGDLRNEALNAPFEAEAYVPFFQSPAFSKHLVVRTQNDPAGIVDAIRRDLRQVDPGVIVENVKTMDRIRDDSISAQRFAMTLISAFSIAALALAVVGIYGVMSHSVAQRTYEFGVRMAVGAQREHILRLVFGHAFALAGIGIILGLVGALVLTRALRTLLFGVESTDLLTFSAVPLLLALTTLLACWLPARRATKIDPLTVLRSE